MSKVRTNLPKELNMIATIFALLVIYQAKHFFADYPLQTPYILGKFKDGWAFFKPLAAHCGVHAFFTLCIVLSFTCDVYFAICLAGLDFIIHFSMDRLKAGKKYFGRFKSLSAGEFAVANSEQKLSNKFFWWALGFDQSVHHLTHYLIVYLIVTK